MSRIKDEQVFECELKRISTYVYRSYFIDKEVKRKVEWFTVLFKDNKTERYFQKHEVHIPNDINKKDLEILKQSVMDYVKTVQVIYEKY